MVEIGTDDQDKPCHHMSPGDDDFTKRMRFHQSWYRVHVLRLPPGPNPAAGGALYGNMLREEDGRAGWNFLNAQVHASVEARLRQDPRGLEAGRLRNNLLSSQPMCFNLFAPLAGDHALATRLMRALPGLPEDLEVTGIRFEYAPDKESHLKDNTAFDVWVEYVLPSGARGFVGIETKLTEPFSRARYEFSERYLRWKRHSDWWWREGAEASFADQRFNQLWRNHLLAFAMLHQDDSRYTHGYCALVHHEGDSGCDQAVQAYRQLLRPEAAHTLLVWRLGDLMERWTSQDLARAHREWINAFRLRYLDLGASRHAWVHSARAEKNVTDNHRQQTDVLMNSEANPTVEGTTA